MKPEDNIGRVLEGKYEVVRLLGTGGMGTVYEARHLRLRGTFALKLLRPEYAGDEDIVKRFEREATTTASLGHENIVDITDMGMTEEGQLYVVMELLKGVELDHVLAETGQVSQGWACHVAVQILSALSAVHERGIVHRDLKPGNIFLENRPGFGDFVKLMDFGIAKVRASEEGLTRGLTRTGQLLGTPWYMSPEQARGDRDVTASSDIYAVGVILYQMLTGELPFGGSSYVEVLMKILTEDPAPPSELRPGLEPRIAGVIWRALAKEPADRFADVTEMARDLEPFADPGAAAEKPLSSLVSGPRVSAPVDLVHVKDPTTSPSPRKTEPIGLAAPSKRVAEERKTSAGVPIAVALVLIAAVAAGWYFLAGPGRGVFSREAEPASPAPAGIAAQDAERTAPSEEVRSDAGTVRKPAVAAEMVRILVTPATASVVVDGRKLAGKGGVFEMPVDGLGHKLEVMADGYLAHSRIYVASVPARVEIKLEKPHGGRTSSRVEGERRSAGSGESAAEPSPAEPPVAEAPAAEPPVARPEEAPTPRVRIEEKEEERAIDEKLPW